MSTNTTKKYLRGMKHFEVIDVDGDLGTLRCPKKDCGGEFTVNREQFKNSRPSAGRSCPYCFRPSIVPGQKIPGK